MRPHFLTNENEAADLMTCVNDAYADLFAGDKDRRDVTADKREYMTDTMRLQQPIDTRMPQTKHKLTTRQADNG